MNICLRIKSSLRLVFIVLMVSALFACADSSDSDSAGDDTDTSTAINNASKNIASIIETNADGIAGVGGDSAALVSLLEPLGISLAANEDGEGLTDELIGIMQSLLDENTSVITRNGNTLTVKPAASVSCDEMALSVGFAQGDDSYNSCLDVMAGIQITIMIKGDETGSLSLSHEGNTPITVSYSPTQLTVAIDLSGSVAALDSVLSVMDPEAALELPETVNGGVELELENLGEQHGSIQLAITQVIQVADSVEGYDITLDPAALLSVEADGIAGTATVTSSLNTISALFPVEIAIDTPVPGELSFIGADVTLNITDAGAGMNASVSIGLLEIDIDSANAISFFLDPDISIDPDTNIITLDSALEMDFSITDTYSLFDDTNGSLSVTAASGTSFSEVTDSLFKIESGSLEFTGTGDFVSMTGTVAQNQCFDIDGPASCL